MAKQRAKVAAKKKAAATPSRSAASRKGGASKPVRGAASKKSKPPAKANQRTASRTVSSAKKTPKKPVAAKKVTKPAPKKGPAKAGSAKRTPAKAAPAKAVAAKTGKAKAAPPARKAAETKVVKKPAAVAKSVTAKKPAQPAKVQQKVKPEPAARPATSSAVQKAASPSKQPLPKQNRGKFLSREFMFELATAIKEAVAPVARSLRGQEVVSTAVSGDATFEIDRIAEKALLNFLRSARAPIAYYSEESGYSTFSNVQPKYLLIVDPIDGTRAAKSAFEGCVVAIGSTQVIERPKMSDLETGCVMEILGDRTFYAERGGGARIYENGNVRRPRLSNNTNLERLAWSMTVPARPAELIFPTAARLVDLSSLKGGFFACNSTSYSITRLLTGQLDAAVDFASRYMRDIPTYVRDYFINAGRGVVLGAAPYDFAAALLIAKEAGCSLTNAYGESFDDVMLLDSSEGNQQSIIAASNLELHQKLFSFFDTRIRQFESLLQRRN